LKFSNCEAVHLGFVLGGASREVTLIVVVFDSLCTSDNLIEEGGFIISGTAELSHRCRLCESCELSAEGRCGKGFSKECGEH